MKAIAAFLLLASAAISPDLRYFRFERPVGLPTTSPESTCLTADAALFAHSATPDLADLRLYHGRVETPYFLQSSVVPATDSEMSVPILNLGVRTSQTVFDAEMPTSRYSDLAIQVSGRDFIAPVRVSGSQTQGGGATRIGLFTIFDLTNQRLGRSTVLHLPESDFRFLHFAVGGHIRPEQVKGLGIERGATTRPAYVDVAGTTHFSQKGKEIVADFLVPAHVPVDQVEVVPGPVPMNFSREVTVRAGSDSSETGAAASQAVSGYGTVLRIHTVQDSHRLDLERLTIQTSPRQSETPSKWTVTIDNGDDVPLMPRQIKLQMIERDICFEAAGDGPYTLYYGDPALSAPRYDLGRVLGFRLNHSIRATSGVEQPNSEYVPRPDSRPFTDRHPSLLWIALILVVTVLGAIAYRTAQGNRPAAS